VKLNPYAPPRSEPPSSTAPATLDLLSEHGPIEFSGALDERDLRDFLRAHGHIGCGWLLGMLLTLAAFLLMLAALAAAAFVAVVGLSAILIAVSTIRYRLLVFQSLNPHWDQPLRGEVNRHGIDRQQAASSSFYRWDWYSGAVVGERIVAFLPATQPAQPLILSLNMLTGQDQWDRLLEVCRAIGIISADGPREDQRAEQNLDMLRQPERPRTIPPPRGAIAFRGRVRRSDFEDLPRAYRRRKRPVRAYVVSVTLAVLSMLLLAAISEALFGPFLLVPGVVLLYAGATAWMVRWRSRSPAGAIYYLNGFATPTSLVTDFTLTTAQTPWSNWRLLRRSDTSLALARRGSTQIIVLRRDMFENQDDWQQLCRLATASADDRAESTLRDS
jgi:hypothetical protein